jgi:hypothetical protein
MIPNRRNQANMVAVHHAAQLARRQNFIAQQNMMRRRRAAAVMLSQPLPAPPKEGRTVEHNVTSLGLEVIDTYTIKEAHLSDGVYQFELLNAQGEVIWAALETTARMPT